MLNRYRPTAAARATSLRARLEDLRRSTGIERLERLVEIAETNVRAAAGKPITDRIYDLLRSNPDMAFAPSEIMECIHAREEHLEAMRKALQRLCARSQILRVSHGHYQANIGPSADGER